MNVASLPVSTMTLSVLCLTIGAYLLGVQIREWAGNPVANPVLIAILLIGGVLHVSHIPYADYFLRAQLIHFLLGPATVALAIPLVHSFEHLRKSFWSVLLALLSGSVVGMASGYGLVRVCGGSQGVALSMLPKSVTTPIAMGVAQSIGGLPSLSAVLAIAGGILIATSVEPILKGLHWNRPATLGVAAGTAGSGIGAAQVIPRHTLSAAFAGVAIGVNGIITAVLAPFITTVFKHLM